MDTAEDADFWLPVHPVHPGRYLLCHTDSPATVASGCMPLTLPGHGTIRLPRGEGRFGARIE